MKTEYREHPLGTPGPAVRTKDESAKPASAPALVGRIGRLLARLGKRAGLG